MKLEVNPTRMEIMNLKRKLLVARRGHKLLKDKQDELMRRFLEILDEVKILRTNVEIEMEDAYKDFIFAKLFLSREILEEALMLTNVNIEATFSSVKVLNVDTPKLDFKLEGDIYSYGFSHTSTLLDQALNKYLKLFPQLLKLAEIEKKAELLSEEIERTRRRVNALEYILIPELEETIKYIDMRLNEAELGNQLRLMKIKEIVRKH
ncbi:MAG: V-type ATP synthase subunit D [Candidatus Firestonebacteria bacterium]|nr:V-type ATP synthase subunit D [Candidatus Firestonebacteria bacterium]